MKRIVLLFTILFSCSSTVFSDDLKDILDILEDDALVVHIIARVIHDKSLTTVWNMEVTRFTIMGKSVNITLTGKNIKVKANITPYTAKNEGILILAQGEVWISPEEGQKVQYMSTLESLAVVPGEKVLFYPLGMKEEKKLQSENSVIIELQIQISPYEKDSSPETEGPENFSGKSSMYQNKRENIVSQALG